MSCRTSAAGGQAARCPQREIRRIGKHATYAAARRAGRGPLARIQTYWTGAFFSRAKYATHPPVALISIGRSRSQYVRMASEARRSGATSNTFASAIPSGGGTSAWHSGDQVRLGLMKRHAHDEHRAAGWVAVTRPSLSSAVADSLHAIDDWPCQVAGCRNRRAMNAQCARAAPCARPPPGPGPGSGRRTALPGLLRAAAAKQVILERLQVQNGEEVLDGPGDLVCLAA